MASRKENNIHPRGGLGLGQHPLGRIGKCEKKKIDVQCGTRRIFEQ